MWKPALFLLTIVAVTPDGRNALEQYLNSGYSLLAVDPKYGNLTIVAIGLLIVGVFLLSLCKSPKESGAVWVVQRVQGPEPANVARR